MCAKRDRKIAAVQKLGESDYLVTVEVDGEHNELIARGVRRDESVGMVVGDFEPTATFHSLAISVNQVRALVRAAARAHFGEPLALLLDVPA